MTCTSEETGLRDSRKPTEPYGEAARKSWELLSEPQLVSSTLSSTSATKPAEDINQSLAVFT